jgi:Fur family ferric uptake transcriptional regulator
VTRPRLAVLAALDRLGGHRGADEIDAELARSGVRVPLTTIYNVVDDLTRAGVVMAADAGPGRALYEVAERRHHHFVCRSCGAVVDVACLDGGSPCLAASIAGAEVDEASIIFRGRCARCAGSPTQGNRAWT